jgi:uncharacterized UPF0160 family protein
MGTLIVGTHNGTFHADEVMACAILSYIEKALLVVTFQMQMSCE